MATFQDHFGKVAGSYASARPGYPASLFEWLAGQCVSHDLAWDCGTGSGQAARGLAAHFERVVATDASEGQIARAVADPRIEYRVADASSSGLVDRSADLVVVAQALHWFDREGFYREVRRVSKPTGLLAVWSYRLPEVEARIDEAMLRLYSDEVGPYWPPERHHIETAYRDLPFPFERIEVPPFSMTANWDVDRYTEYLRSWSATARYVQAKGVDPVEKWEPELRRLWGAGERRVEWPIDIRVGRVRG